MPIKWLLANLKRCLLVLAVVLPLLGNAEAQMIGPSTDREEAEEDVQDSIFERECRELIGTYETIQHLKESGSLLTRDADYERILRIDFGLPNRPRVRVVCWKDISSKSYIKFDLSPSLRDLK